EHVHAAYRQRRARRALKQALELRQRRVERDLADDRREPRELIERALPREQRCSRGWRLPLKLGQEPRDYVGPPARRRAPNGAGRVERRRERARGNRYARRQQLGDAAAIGGAERQLRAQLGPQL